MRRTVFTRALIANLRRGEVERFELLPSAEPRLVAALKSDLRSPDASERLQVILRFAAALDGKMASPLVASQLRRLLKAEPLVVALLRSSRTARRSLDEVRRFAAREGRVANVVAPRLGQAAPPGTVPLRQLLEPQRQPVLHRPGIGRSQGGR